MILLVVDTQKLLMNEKLFHFIEFVDNIKELIQIARKNHVEVIYVRHDDGIGEELTKETDGYEIYDEIKPIGNEKIFDKRVNSPFQESGLLDYLREKKVQDIIVVGLQTDYCIDATIKCGFEHGFHMIVPAYCHTTTDNSFMNGEKSYHYYNDFLWQHRYADCLSLYDTIQLMENNS